MKTLFTLVLVSMTSGCLAARADRPRPRLPHPHQDARSVQPGDVLVGFEDHRKRPSQARILPLHLPAPDAWRYRLTQ